MKKTILTSTLALTAAFMLAAPSIAQTTTTVESLNSAGTISEFSPDAITIQSSSAPAPVHYSATRTTTYVDDTGAPVSMDVVKSGLPVTVYYTKSGDDMVASRVVVNRTTTTAAPVAPVVEEKKTTTTTTTTDQ